MHRKALGFLLLALVVIAGIVFVEIGQPSQDADARGKTSATYPVVLGHEDGLTIPRANGAPLAGAPEGGGDRTPAAGGDRPERPPGSSGEKRPRPAPPLEFKHLVRKGENLSSIVKAYFGTAAPSLIDRVARENRLGEGGAVRADSTLLLRVERYDQHRTSGQETLRDVSLRYFKERDRTACLRRMNPDLPASDSDLIPAGRTLFIPR